MQRDADRDVRPGYGFVTKTLHWLMVAAFAGQFMVGYMLDVDDSGRGRGRGRGRSGESGRGRGRGRGGDEELLDAFGDDALFTVHVVLGVTILALTVIRVIWRWRTTLPPWAPGLRKAERTLAHWTERALYVLMFVVPSTGLWLVLVSDDALSLHVASHIAFFVALAFHIGLVLKHQLIDRDRLLRRML